MSVTADADQEQHPGGDEWTRGPAPAPLPDATPRGAPGQPDAVRQISRRPRRRGPRQQAVFRRRRPFFFWSDEAARVSTGLAVLLLLVVAISLQGLLERRTERETTPADSATVAEAPTAVPESTATAAPVPTPAGPVLSQRMIEANGPIAGCTFLPSLATFLGKIGPTLVGDCVEDALVAVDADASQRTTNGQLIWHRADGHVSFTDGKDTWLEGPRGIVRRRDQERYAWEPDADAGPRPQRTSVVLPPPLPGAVLPARRIVSFYGNPLSATMGILGELSPDQVFGRLRTQVAAFATADKSRPVTPALELVAVVAQPQPGPEGLYRLRMDPSLIDKVAGWAEQNDCLLILDVQTGRGNVDAEIQWLLPYLKRPNVHLALDPEFSMPSGQVPGQRIGTMDASTVTQAVQTMAALVTSEQLPPKLLLVHRFTEDMVTNAQAIVTDPRVQVVVVMDGFGSPSVKTRQYDELIVDQRVEHTGLKLFFHHDEPLLTPDQVLQLDPPPDLIIYQ
jgi:hypothetical protein